MRRLFLALALGTASACAPFPDIDARIPAAERAVAPPPLVPLGPLLAGTRGQDAARAIEAAGSGIAGRVAALNARAAGLRRPVVGSETLRRFDRGVDLSALN